MDSEVGTLVYIRVGDTLTVTAGAPGLQLLHCWRKFQGKAQNSLYGN
jgi:hypothetical protein